MTRHRIAIGTIFTECNELGGLPIDISWFERYELFVVTRFSRWRAA